MTKEIHDINTRALDFVVELIDYIAEYPNDDYMTMECLCRKLVKHGLLDKADGYYQTHDICTNTHECVKDTHDKTENSSEIPNNCKDEPNCEGCKHFNKQALTYMKQCKYYFMECKFEPKVEPQFDKDINVRSKDEPQTERSE